MKSDSIIFVTTNKGKVSEAEQHFNKVKLEIYNHELIEPRSDDIEEIAKSKVLQAYEIVKKPCIAVDSGFFIDALNGFPKAFVNFTLNTIGIDGILKLMKDNKNRDCYFKECLAYYDGSEMKLFHRVDNGTVSAEVKGKNDVQKWSGLWYIFIPEFSKDGRTQGEFSQDEIYEIRKKSNSTISQFANWYENEKR
jgi:XTP/dITP diphosphohydrolase